MNKRQWFLCLLVLPQTKNNQTCRLHSRSSYVILSMILPFCRHFFCVIITLHYPSDVITPYPVFWVASACEKRPTFFDFPTFRHVPGSVIGLATAPVPPPATHTGRRSISAESGGQLVTNSFSWSGLKLKDSNQGFIVANPAGMIQNNSWFSSKFGWKSSFDSQEWN